jgi:hypothetical protein
MTVFSHPCVDNCITYDTCQHPVYDQETRSYESEHLTQEQSAHKDRAYHRRLHLAKIPLLRIEFLLVCCIVKPWKEYSMKDGKTVAQKAKNAPEVHGGDSSLSYRAGIMLGISSGK